MKIQKANLKSGLKIVKASTAEMGGKTERPRVRVRGYIRMEMMRNEWTRKSSISGGVCGEELDEYCFHLQSTKKRNNSYIFIEECILGHVFVSLFKHLFSLMFEIINFCSLFSGKV